MTRYQAVLIASAFATACLMGEEGADPKTVQAVSQLVLQAESPYELRVRLPECCPGIATEHDALNVLFGSVRAGTATDETWNAVHRIREMGEGAWILEYQGAAYRALQASPRAYYERYLKGDGQAAELMSDAFDSARNQIETGPGCAPKWGETAAHSEKVLGSALESVRAVPPPSEKLLLVRHSEFLNRMEKLYGEWQKYLEVHKIKCAEQEKQAP